MNYFVEHLNMVLYAIAGILTLLEIIMRWVVPSIRKKPAWAGFVETVDSFWVAIVVALSLKAVLIQPFTIPSESMVETLKKGDYILVKKYEYGYSLLNMTSRFMEFKKPQRRDIVVFVFPGDHSKDYIKRCVGISGDVIEYKDKVLYVNGEMQDEPYAIHASPDIMPRGNISEGSRDNFGPVTVATGHYFMMGDNRDNSYDSRYWGQLDEKLIKGKAWVIYWYSIGTASFLVLVALVLSGLTAIYLAFLWAGDRLFLKKKLPAENEAQPQTLREIGEKTEAQTQGAISPYRSPLLTIVVSLIVAALLLAWIGPSTFRANYQKMKERIFTKIK
jgi:signal peptidase I